MLGLEPYTRKRLKRENDDWTIFLTKGLYDPRIFINVFYFM
jgi:hypothetical protein